VWNPLAVVIMLASLGVGAWCLVSAARGRFLNQAQYTALLALAAVALVQTLIGSIRLIAGDRPVELVTFIGYLITTALFLPAGLALARMEPTRWGSVIAGVAALTVAVLTLRLIQVWTPLR
jgi:cell shape-determining protein MreD